MSKTILIAGTDFKPNAELAKLLSNKGHSVILVMSAISTERKNPPSLLSFPNIELKEIDLGEHNRIRDTFEDIGRKYENIDVFINHISYSGLGTIQTTSIEEVKEVYDVAFWHSMDMVKAAIPFMKRNKEGLIINLMYGSHLFAIPFLLAYEISKFAIEGLTKCIRSEIHKYNIDIMSIYQEKFPPQMTFKPHCDVENTAKNKDCYPFQIELERYAKMVSYGLENAEPDLNVLSDIILSQIYNVRDLRPTQIVFNPISGEGVAFHEEKNNNDWIKHMGLTEL